MNIYGAQEGTLAPAFLNSKNLTQKGKRQMNVSDQIKHKLHYRADNVPCLRFYRCIALYILCYDYT